ncbi:hypothetical protein HDU97_009509 [Phlyctochytrium planicorne]|nr:hypothetical protein HDU97_009509 [Phlyctochytrium planicorne]
MNTPNLLENVKVTIQQVDSYNPKFAVTFFVELTLSDSGGYASATIYDTLMKENGRRNYEYFWRMQPGNGLGIHLVRLLNYMKSNRVALIAGSSGLAKSLHLEAESTLTQNNIVVSSSLYLTTSMMAAKNFTFIFDLVKNSKARYIVCTMLTGDIENFYFAAAKYGLVGPEYVWMGIIWPLISPTDPEAKWKYPLVEGFIQIVPMTLSLESFAGKRFLRQYWREIRNAHPEWIDSTIKESSPPLSRYAAPSYDCMKTMLIGIDSFMKRNSISASNLSQPFWQSRLKIDSFANTGYSGASAELIELTPAGDAKAPYIFVTMTEKSAGSSLAQISDAFGYSGFANVMVELNKPRFNGGNSIPPPPSPIAIAPSISANKSILYTLKILYFISIALNAIAALRLISVFLHTWEVKSFGNIFRVLGSILLTVSVSWFEDSADFRRCSREAYFDTTGFTLIFSSSLYYCLQVYQNFNNELSDPVNVRRPGFYLLMILAALMNSFLVWFAQQPGIAHGSGEGKLDECAHTYIGDSLWIFVYCVIYMYTLGTWMFSGNIRCYILRSQVIFNLTMISAFLYVSASLTSTVLKQTLIVGDILSSILTVKICIKLTLACGTASHIIAFVEIENLKNPKKETQMFSNSHEQQGYIQKAFHVGTIGIQTRKTFKWSDRKRAHISLFLTSRFTTMHILEISTGKIHFLVLKNVYMNFWEEASDTNKKKYFILLEGSGIALLLLAKSVNQFNRICQLAQNSIDSSTGRTTATAEPEAVRRAMAVLNY